MKAPLPRLKMTSFFLLLTLSIMAKEPPSSLFNELAAMDQALFKAGYDCNFDAFDTLVAEDLEFYHDQSPTSFGRESFKQGIQRLCANEGRLRRELIAGSLKVYPMHDGAVQMGVHRFFIKTKDGKLAEASTAKFIHLWKKKDGKWLLARVISYDHQLPPTAENR